MAWKATRERPCESDSQLEGADVNDDVDEAVWHEGIVATDGAGLCRKNDRSLSGICDEPDRSQVDGA